MAGLWRKGEKAQADQKARIDVDFCKNVAGRIPQTKPASGRGALSSLSPDSLWRSRYNKAQSRSRSSCLLQLDLACWRVAYLRDLSHVMSAIVTTAAKNANPATMALTTRMVSVGMFILP
jgi:hypothetical protein